MTGHHRIAIVTISLSVTLAAVFGTLFASVEHMSEGLGIYWATATVTTVGYGDITAKTVAGHWIAEFTMLTAIPLWTATFSLFTSGLMAIHIRRSEKRIREAMPGGRPGD